MLATSLAKVRQVRPSGYARPNFANPITHRLSMLVNLDSMAPTAWTEQGEQQAIIENQDYVAVALEPNIASSTVGEYGRGIALDSDRLRFAKEVGIGNADAVANGVTILAVLRFGGNTGEIACWDSDTGGAGWGFCLQEGSSTISFNTVHLTPLAESSANLGTLVAGQHYVVVGRCLPAAEISIAASNGVLNRVSLTATSGLRGGASVGWRLGQARFTNSQGYPNGGAVYAAATWRRVLSDNETLSLIRNPWQVFASRQQILYLGGAGTYSQARYRWRYDDGNESTASWAGAENTNISIGSGEARRLRVQVQGGGGTTDEFQLEYRKVGDPDWKKVV